MITLTDGGLGAKDAEPRAAAPQAQIDAPPAPAKSRVADAIDWQRLWLAAQRSAWRSLALIPIGEGISSATIAAGLASVGRRHLGGTIVACDATDVTLSTLNAHLDALAERVRCAERAIVALPPVPVSPAAVALARAADAAILCIALDESAVAEARHVMEEVGADRVLGAVIVKKRKKTS